jgi:hypothetical protein
LKWWTPAPTPAKTPGMALQSSTEWLGGPVDTAVVIDAAKLGSAAHRVRAFWTNAAPSRTLKQRYRQFKRE